MGSEYNPFAGFTQNSALLKAAYYFWRGQVDLLLNNPIYEQLESINVSLYGWPIASLYHYPTHRGISIKQYDYVNGQYWCQDQPIELGSPEVPFYEQYIDTVLASKQADQGYTVDELERLNIILLPTVPAIEKALSAIDTFLSAKDTGIGAI